jgi:hypothetical protein
MRYLKAFEEVILIPYEDWNSAKNNLILLLEWWIIIHTQ